MACNICGNVFINNYQLGPNKRICKRTDNSISVRAQGRSTSSSDSDSEAAAAFIFTPVEVVRQGPAEVCLRDCVNRERDWHKSRPALFATRPPATSNSMARDYRPVSALFIFILLAHYLLYDCFASCSSLVCSLIIYCMIVMLVASCSSLICSLIYFMIVASCSSCGKSMSSALTTLVLPRFGASLMLFEAKL